MSALGRSFYGVVGNFGRYVYKGRVRCGGVRCFGFRRLLGLFCGFFTDEKIEVKREEGSCRKFGF